MPVEVKVTGLPDLKAALASIGPKLRIRALRNALAAGARVVQKEARAHAPVLTPENARRAPYRAPGTVRKAISVRTSKIARRAGDVGVFVNVKPAKSGQRGAKNPKDPFYWRWINFGWTPAHGTRNKAPIRAGAGSKARGSTVKGIHFLEAGGRKLAEALQVFIAKIGPQIKKFQDQGKDARL